MGRFVKGDVVVVPFPFSDLSDSKRRPALVLARAGRRELLLCRITSKAFQDEFTIPLEGPDFEKGGLRVASHLRPNHLFTAEERIVLYRTGRLPAETLEQAQDSIKRMLDA